MKLEELKELLERKIAKMKKGNKDYEVELYMKGKQEAYEKCLKWLEGA